MMTTTHKEHFILFNDSMVQALLDGTKTQTRRVVKLEPDDLVTLIEKVPNKAACCPYGQVGDQLWVSAASRITIEITSVRVERLQDITRGDCIAEGCPFPNITKETDPKNWYSDLWTSINDADSWDLNPWVWVIEFKKMTHHTTLANSRKKILEN